MTKIKKINYLTLRIVLSAILITVGVLVCVFRTQINNLFNKDDNTAVVNFQMYVVDVGLGDSIYLEFPDGKNMLVDAGEKSEYEKLSSFLEEKDVETINYFVYTHPDADHIGGGKSVFDDYKIEALYRPRALSKTESETYGNPNSYSVKDTIVYNDAIMAAYNEVGCTIKYSTEGDEISGENYTITFLNPESTYTKYDNNSSAVLMIEVYGKKILLAGDAEEDVEERLVAKYGNDLDADVLKVAHHGSKTASTSEFVNIVTPDYALISVGDNQWDFPHDEVLENLEKAGTKEIINTKDNGTISVGIATNSSIYVNGIENKFELDLPIVLSALFVLLLLVWGIKLCVKTKK